MKGICDKVSETKWINKKEETKWLNKLHNLGEEVKKARNLKIALRELHEI